jgi:alkylation response protein AidB-like acyl-CoA dehydrogenase
MGTEVQLRLTVLRFAVAGRGGLALRLNLGANDVGVVGCFAAAAPFYFTMRKVSIFGGSNEIQKNIIAKGVLGL